MPKGMAAAVREAVAKENRAELELERTSWGRTGYVNVVEVKGEEKAATSTVEPVVATPATPSKTTESCCICIQCVYVFIRVSPNPANGTSSQHADRLPQKKIFPSPAPAV